MHDLGHRALVMHGIALGAGNRTDHGILVLVAAVVDLGPLRSCIAIGA